jgi:hypothetical protein
VCNFLLHCILSYWINLIYIIIFNLNRIGDDIAGWAEETPALALTNTLTSATLVGCYNPNATEHDFALTLACMRASDPATLANTVNYLPYVSTGII